VSDSSTLFRRQREIVDAFVKLCTRACCHAALEPSAFDAAIATRFSRPTSSYSIIIACRPTRRHLLSTTTLTPPTSTRGDVIWSWSSRQRL